jgi:hypothetical protein
MALPQSESMTMPKFIPYDPRQSRMVVISYADQLQAGTFEFAINHIIDHKLDLTIFHPRYQNDEGMNTDSQKLRSFVAPLSAAGYGRR